MDEKNDEGNEIPSKKKTIAPLYSEASWLNRIKIPNNKHKMVTRKRQRSGSFLAENSEIRKINSKIYNKLLLYFYYTNIPTNLMKSNY